MTNSEVIKKLKKVRNTIQPLLYINETIDYAIEALEQTMWIPVSERLPKENTSVIGTTEFNDIYVTELYNDCGKNKWYADGNYDVPIVAWMPLPELYREGERDK